MALCLLFAFSLPAQFPQPPGEDPEPKRLPNGKLQSEEILKADYKANLKDLAELRRLTDSIEEETKKNQGHVLALKTFKDLEEIEKIVKRMRTRMKRY
ncbi:hypothetical protein [Paludibaculum fermentans]|uniref:hypothetical protein n=1 Tax=Paludibaculum fermentans TaxID=1473598 RepID=UPI003EBB2F6E